VRAAKILVVVKLVAAVLHQIVNQILATVYLAAVVAAAVAAIIVYRFLQTIVVVIKLNLKETSLPILSYFFKW
jgi:hypothetical protein